MKEKQSNRFHALSVEETLRQLGSSRTSGLTRAEASRRRRRLGTNMLWRVSGVPVSRLAAGEIFDFAVILLLITAATAAVFERGAEAASIAVLLAVSAALRTVTAVAAQRIFEDAAKSNVPRALALRDGCPVSLKAEDVVPGDILFLSPGDTAVCDARLISGEADVVETPLTGAEGIRRKRAQDILLEDAVCSQRSNILFASTMIVSGAACAVAVATGERTYAYARRGYISIDSGGETAVVSRLNSWCRSVSLIMLTAVLAVTLGGFFLRGSSQLIDELFLSALSLAVASMSEFLCVIASIILACSVQQFSRATGGSAVIKKPDAIEKAANARMVVFTSEAQLQSGNFRLGDWCSEGVMRKSPQDTLPAGLSALMELTELCCGYGSAALSTSPVYLQECENAALVRRLRRTYNDASPRAPEGVLAFAPDKHLNTVLRAEEGAVYAYICGTLSDVLACCADSAAGAITWEERQKLLAYDGECRRRSVRTVAIARRLSPYHHLARVAALQSKMTLLGFYTVLDPVDVSFAQLVAKCREGHIRLALVTEHEEQACFLAKKAGILTEEDVLIRDDLQALALYLEEEHTRNAVLCFSDRERREEALRKLCASSRPSVCAGSSLSDMALFPLADVSAAAELPLTPLPQCAQRSADVVLHHRSNERANSPAHETLRMIGYCRNALANVRCAAEYLLLSQTMRLTLVIASAVLRLPMLSPLQVLFLGLVLDYAAVLTMAFVSPRLGVMILSGTHMQLPTLKSGMLFPLSAGVLSGVFLAAIPVLLSRFGCSMNAADGRFLAFCGCVLASFAAAQIQLSPGVRRCGGWKINAAYLIYTLLSLAALAAAFLSVANGPARLYLLAASAAPGAVLLILSLLYRHASGISRK